MWIITLMTSFPISPHQTQVPIAALRSSRAPTCPSYKPVPCITWEGCPWRSASGGAAPINIADHSGLFIKKSIRLTNITIIHFRFFLVIHGRRNRGGGAGGGGQLPPPPNILPTQKIQDYKNNDI